MWCNWNSRSSDLAKNLIYRHKEKFEHYTLFKKNNISFLKYSGDPIIISVIHKKKYIELIGIYATNLYFRKQMHLCATKCSVKLIKIPIKERIIFIHHNNTIKDIFVVFHCKMNNIVIPKKNYLRAIFLSIGSSDANCPHNSICKGKKGSWVALKIRMNDSCLQWPGGTIFFDQ